MATSTATTTTTDTSSKAPAHGLTATVRYVKGSPALACLASLMVLSVVLGGALLIYMLLWPSDKPKPSALRPTVTPDDDNATKNGSAESSPVAGAASDKVAVGARRHTATLPYVTARVPSSPRGASTGRETDPPDSVVSANATNGIQDLHNVPIIDANRSHMQREIAMMEALFDLGAPSDAVTLPGPADNGTAYINSSRDATLTSSTGTRRDDYVLFSVDREKPPHLETPEYPNESEGQITGTLIRAEGEVNFAESNTRFHYTNTTDVRTDCNADTRVTANASEQENFISSRAKGPGDASPGHTARPSYATQGDESVTDKQAHAASSASSLGQNRSEKALRWQR